MPTVRPSRMIEPSKSITPREQSMSLNKNTVEKYIDGFNKSDHQQILSCLTDDIEWLMPGTFHLAGKDAFDKEIENDAFTGSPVVKITRMSEENDVIIAEGTVRVAWKDGGFLNAVFCDVFEMENTKIKRLTTYQVNLKEEAF
jgi:ketosteroid isomerase-like protein